MKSLIIIIILGAITFIFANNKCVHFWFSQQAINDMKIVYNIPNMQPSQAILQNGKTIRYTEVYMEKNHNLEYKDSKYIGCGFLIK